MNAETDPQNLPEHVLRPHLRPIQPIPVKKDDQPFVALRDPNMLTQQTMVVAPSAFQVIQLFRGEKTVHELAEQIKSPVEPLVQLAQKLDEMGLIWGPTAERLEGELKAKLAERGAFPIGAAGSLGQTADDCRQAIDHWFQQSEDPEVDDMDIRAVIAPHLDYQRGWPNYAAAYYGLRNAPTPDRVVVLGTNHFGIGDGVVVSEYGFDTPLGRVASDTAVISALKTELGDALTVDQIDHMGEHSIQLQLPWLQHLFGDVPVIAALVPDPLTPLIEDDGARVGWEPFTEGLRKVLDEAGGRSLIVSSADLSHVGPQFGEPRPVDAQRRTDVERHDREMMERYLSGDVKDFLDAMRWSKNPTRWCSIGSMSTTLAASGAGSVELIDYRQAIDEQGLAMVSSCAMVLAP